MSAQHHSPSTMLRIAAHVVVAYALVGLSFHTDDPWTAGLMCGASAVLMGQAAAQMVRASGRG